MSEVETVFYRLAVAAMYFILASLITSCVYLCFHIIYCLYSIIREVRRKGGRRKG